jgi:glyoxylase I family protein
MGIHMMLSLHHINLIADNVQRMEDFYCNVLGLRGLPEMLQLRKMQSYDGKVAFVDGNPTQLHLAARDDELGFRMQQVVNPVTASGHIAFRTDNIDQIKAQLVRHKVPFSDYGVFAMQGWHQIFFYDPSGRVIEVHEVKA